MQKYNLIYVAVIIMAIPSYLYAATNIPNGTSLKDFLTLVPHIRLTNSIPPIICPLTTLADVVVSPTPSNNIRNRPYLQVTQSNSNSKTKGTLNDLLIAAAALDEEFALVSNLENNASSFLEFLEKKDLEKARHHHKPRPFTIQEITNLKTLLTSPSFIESFQNEQPEALKEDKVLLPKLKRHPQSLEKILLNIIQTTDQKLIFEDQIPNLAKFIIKARKPTSYKKRKSKKIGLIIME